MVIKNGWSLGNNTGPIINISPLFLVAGKLKNLKEHIKKWRNEIIEANRKELVELTNTINFIGLLAESAPVNKNLIKNHLHVYQKIMEIEYRRIEDLKQKSRIRWALEGYENSSFFMG